LRAALGAKRPRAQGATVPAAAIPLRKATPGGGTQYLYAHSRSLQFGARVTVDFAVQADFFKLRTGPFHGSLLRFLAGFNSSYVVATPDIGAALIIAVLSAGFAKGV